MTVHFAEGSAGLLSSYSIQKASPAGGQPAVDDSETTMNQRDIAQQTLLEQNLLTNITQAIRTTIAWEPRGDDVGESCAACDSSRPRSSGIWTMSWTSKSTTVT